MRCEYHEDGDGDEDGLSVLFTPPQSTWLIINLT